MLLCWVCFLGAVPYCLHFGLLFFFGRVFNMFMFFFVCVFVLVCACVCLCVCLLFLFVCLLVCVCLSVCLDVCLPAWLFGCVCVVHRPPPT